MRRPYTRVAINQRLMVNLDDGKAVHGVLWDERGDLLVLRDAELLVEGQNATSLDGEVVVDRARILFCQIAQPIGAR